MKPFEGDSKVCTSGRKKIIPDREFWMQERKKQKYQLNKTITSNWGEGKKY